MMTTNIAGRKVVLYDSIDELPIVRFHKFNKYLLIDAGIGSDISDITNKIAVVNRHIDKKDLSSAKIELENIRQAMYLVSQENNVKHLSFSVLVKSIDGEELTDLSDEGFKKVQNLLNSTNTLTINLLLESVKKKINEELEAYFPSQFNEAATKEYFDHLKKRTLLQLDSVVRKNDNRIEIERVDDYLFSLVKPKNFAGKDGAEIAFDKQFEDACIFLRKELSTDAREMTVLQFYNAFEFIKKQSK